MNNNNILTNQNKQLLNVALVAGIFEWYDFSLYALLSSTIGLLFFTSEYPFTKTLAAFTLYALSYFARPLGGIFFGRLGDQTSRSQALKLSLMTMAVPTIIIGLLPTYSQAGLIGTGLLCILRLIQGFGMGGEFPNSISYVFDTATPRYRTFLSSITCASTSIGILCGSTVISLLFWFFEPQVILDWAWRIPFLLSIPMTYYIAWLRQSLQDAPRNITNEEKSQQNTQGTFTRLNAVKYDILRVILLGGVLTICSNIFLIWMPFYLSHFLSIPQKTAYLMNTVTLSIEISTLIASGYAVYFLNARSILTAQLITLIAVIYPLFQLLTWGSYGALLTFSFVSAILLGSMNACFIEVMGQLLPFNVRSLVTSIVFAVSPAFLGGTAPLLCTYFTNKTGILSFPAFYIMTFALIALLALHLMPGRAVETIEPSGTNN